MTRQDVREAMTYCGLGLYVVALIGILLGIAPIIMVSGWAVGIVMMFIAIFL